MATRRIFNVWLWLLPALSVAFVVWMAGRWVLPGAVATRGLAQTTPAERQKQEVHTVAVSDISHTMLVTGELRAARSREIKVPEMKSGFAAAITFLVPEGSSVKQGQRILEFDASSQLSQKFEAERKLDEAKLKIEKTKADLEAQRSDLLNELAQAEGSLKIAQLYGKIGKELLPANQYQKYQLDLEKAQLALEKAKERLGNHQASVPAQLALVELERAQAELELKKIQGDLSLLEVDAPQDGIIIYGDNWASNRKIQVGDTLHSGMSVLSLPDLSSMQVVAFVYDTELRFLSTGMSCDLRLDAVPGRVWRGTVVSLTSVASRKGFASQHKVFRAVIQPDAVDLALMKPGMTVRLELPIKLASQVVAIPREYLGLDSRGLYYARKGDDSRTAVAQIVKVGVFSDRLVQILEGLRAGDRIVRP